MTITCYMTSLCTCMRSSGLLFNLKKGVLASKALLSREWKKAPVRKERKNQTLTSSFEQYCECQASLPNRKFAQLQPGESFSVEQAKRSLDGKNTRIAHKNVHKSKPDLSDSYHCDRDPVLPQSILSSEGKTPTGSPRTRSGVHGQSARTCMHTHAHTHTNTD